MPGSPLKRQRKLGVRAAHSGVISFPRMPRVVDLSPRWGHFSTVDKIRHLLDRALEIVSALGRARPAAPLSQVQVIRIILIVAGKALLNGSLDRRTQRASR